MFARNKTGLVDFNSNVAVISDGEVSDEYSARFSPLGVRVSSSFLLSSRHIPLFVEMFSREPLWIFFIDVEDEALLPLLCEALETNYVVLDINDPKVLESLVNLAAAAAQRRLLEAAKRTRDKKLV